MRVEFKYGHQQDFNYKEGDHVTIVLAYLTAPEPEDELYYHGTLMEIDEGGVWCIIDGQPDKEEYIAFADIEAIAEGDKIPFLAGWTKRSKRTKG